MIGSVLIGLNSAAKIVLLTFAMGMIELLFKSLGKSPYLRECFRAVHLRVLCGTTDD
jgi:hypothetical protein